QRHDTRQRLKGATTMTSIKKLACIALALIGGLALSGCAATTQDFSATTPSAYEGPKTIYGETLISQLHRYAGAANPQVVFMVGECQDKTGKFLDGGQLRYSRAVTQACPELLANFARGAGFKVAERNPYN